MCNKKKKACRETNNEDYKQRSENKERNDGRKRKMRE
jgi:hypothetical protein